MHGCNFFAAIVEVDGHLIDRVNGGQKRRTQSLFLTLNRLKHCHIVPLTSAYEHCHSVNLLTLQLDTLLKRVRKTEASRLGRDMTGVLDSGDLIRAIPGHMTHFELQFIFGEYIIQIFKVNF